MRAAAHRQRPLGGALVLGAEARGGDQGRDFAACDAAGSAVRVAGQALAEERAIGVYALGAGRIAGVGAEEALVRIRRAVRGNPLGSTYAGDPDAGEGVRGKERERREQGEAHLLTELSVGRESETESVGIHRHDPASEASEELKDDLHYTKDAKYFRRL